MKQARKLMPWLPHNGRQGRSMPPYNGPRKGEVPLKEFLAEEAARRHCSPRTVFKYYRSGHYRNLKVRRVNSRVVMVAVPKT